LRKVMVFQHSGHEPLGTLNPLLKASGLKLRYLNFARDPNVTHEQVLSGSLRNMDRSLFLSLSVFQKWINFFPLNERS